MVDAPFVAGSATSMAAAASLSSKDRARKRAMVFAFVFKQGIFGATRQEIEAGTKIPGNTVRPRVVELLDSKDLIVTNRVRLTDAGREAEVLMACRLIP